MAKFRGVKQKQAKNKKRNWKKIKHNDVESFLDDAREDERLGGIKSKSNQDLFLIDNVGFIEDPTEVDTPRTQPTDELSVEDKSTGPLVKTNDLKCFRLLKPHTSVKDPLIQRNRVRVPGERKSVQMELKDVIRRNKKQPYEIKETPVTDDPWAMQEVKGDLDSEWVESSTKRHNIKLRVRPSAKHVTSELPAIEMPHGGFSYNPSFKDHQDLLRTAVAIETRNITRERNLIRAIAPTKCDTEEKVGLLSESEDDDSSAHSDDDVKPKIGPKSKTRQSKRKQREEKEKVRLSQLRKSDNARLNEVFRIKTLKKEIKATEKQQKERLAKTVAKKILRDKFGQKKLSKFKYQELTLDPALSEEIQGSLVGVPAHNRVLLERFKSLQKRNIVEPRERNRMKRKLKLKKFQRPSEKMEWEKTGFWNGIKVLHNDGRNRNRNRRK